MVYERLYYEPTPHGAAPAFWTWRSPMCVMVAQLFKSFFDDRLAAGLAGSAVRHAS
jgi:hypothetical protein